MVSPSSSFFGAVSALTDGGDQFPFSEEGGVPFLPLNLVWDQEHLLSLLLLFSLARVIIRLPVPHAHLPSQIIYLPIFAPVSRAWGLSPFLSSPKKHSLRSARMSWRSGARKETDEKEKRRERKGQPFWVSLLSPFFSLSLSALARFLCANPQSANCFSFRRFERRSLRVFFLVRSAKVQMSRAFCSAAAARVPPLLFDFFISWTIISPPFNLLFYSRYMGQCTFLIVCFNHGERTIVHISSASELPIEVKISFTSVVRVPGGARNNTRGAYSKDRGVNREH